MFLLTQKLFLVCKNTSSSRIHTEINSTKRDESPLFVHQRQSKLIIEEIIGRFSKSVGYLPSIKALMTAGFVVF